MTGKKTGSTYDEVLDSGSKRRGNDKCAIDQIVQLQRVDSNNIKGLARGRTLTIALHNENGVKSVVCRRPDNSRYVGSVAFSNVKRLIDCMTGGRGYEARIEDIAEAAIHVRISDI